MTWHTLGTPAPDQLPATREQLHCVAQVVASVPRLLATPEDDWGTRRSPGTRIARRCSASTFPATTRSASASG